MSAGTRRVVTLIALAALAAAAWWYLQRRKRQREEAEQLAAAIPSALPSTAPAMPLPAAPPSAPSAPSAPAAPEPPPVHVTDETEALARVIASEAGLQDVATQTRIAWVARNRARARGQTIAQMVCQPCGKQVGNQRPFSSRQAPSEPHRAVARQVLAGPASADPTRGAINILEPSLMDRLFAKGRAKWNAMDVRRRWLRGLDYYGSAGGWDFFGPKGGPGAQPVPQAWIAAGVLPGQPAAAT